MSNLITSETLLVLFSSVTQVIVLSPPLPPVHRESYSSPDLPPLGPPQHHDEVTCEVRLKNLMAANYPIASMGPVGARGRGGRDGEGWEEVRGGTKRDGGGGMGRGVGRDEEGVMEGGEGRERVVGRERRQWMRRTKVNT